MHVPESVFACSGGLRQMLPERNRENLLHQKCILPYMGRVKSCQYLTTFYSTDCHCCLGSAIRGVWRKYRWCYHRWFQCRIVPESILEILPGSLVGAVCRPSICELYFSARVQLNSFLWSVVCMCTHRPAWKTPVMVLGNCYQPLINLWTNRTCWNRPV